MNAVLHLAVPVTAEDVNEAHRLARSCAENAVQHAIRCGELLLAKKAELESRGKDHGRAGFQRDL